MRVGLAQCAGSEPLAESLHDPFMETSSCDLVAVMAGVPAPDTWPARSGRTNGCLDELELAPVTREEAQAW